MFGLLDNIVKVAASVVTVPVALAADVVTVGGLTTNQEESYTVQELQKTLENVQKLTG